MKKPLCELLITARGPLEYQRLKGDLQSPIAGLAYDSRQVQPGFLFAALPGLKTDGHRFLQEALRRGAVAVMIERGKEALLPAETPVAFSVPNPRFALAVMAANLYEHPSLHLHLVGITGTNGKSTTAHLINGIHRAAGFRSGLIGTLAYQLGEESRPAPHTTPEAPDLQALLAEMRDRAITHATMEVSSHALAQHRADGCQFQISVFTNLSRDHLDYHADEEEYLSAKLRLFADPAFLPAEGERADVINADDSAAQRFVASALGKIITYGLSPEAQVRAADLRLSAAGTQFTLLSPWGEKPVKLRLLGRFNVYNALAAIGATVAGGISLETALSTLEEAQAPTGRFQQVPSADCTVIVDYAHTPDGLEKALSTARDFCRGRLFVVFGCGGDRDTGKRPLMGEVCSRLAEMCVITSDNPRSEDPQAIIQQILLGVDAEHQAKCLVEPDRAKAISLAIAQAQKEDLVLLAGKGHETYQIFADRTLHFDDREVAEAALREKARTPGKA